MSRLMPGSMERWTLRGLWAHRLHRAATAFLGLAILVLCAGADSPSVKGWLCTAGTFAGLATGFALLSQLLAGGRRLQ